MSIYASPAFSMYSTIKHTFRNTILKQSECLLRPQIMARMKSSMPILTEGLSAPPKQLLELHICGCKTKYRMKNKLKCVSACGCRPDTYDHNEFKSDIED